MSDIYMGYLTEAEREDEIKFASINTEIENTLAMLEMVSLRSEIKARDIELMVFKESGTYEDLEKLWTEAEETAQKDQGGLLDKLFAAVKALAKGIIDGISNAFNTLAGKVNAEAEVKVDKGEYDTINKFASAWNNIKSTVGNTVSGITGGNGEGNIDPKALGIAALTATGSVVAVKAGAVKKLVETCKDAAATIQQWTSNLEAWSKPKEGDGTVVTIIKKAMGGMQNILNIVNSYVKKASDWIKGVAGTAVDKVKGVAGKVAGKFKKRADGNIDLTSVDDNLKKFKFNYKDPQTQEQKKVTVTLSNPAEGETRKYNISIDAADGHIAATAEYWNTANGKALIKKADEAYNKIIAESNKPAEQPAAEQPAEAQPAEGQEAAPAENQQAQESVSDDVLKSIFGDDYVIVDESVNNETEELIDEFASLF